MIKNNSYFEGRVQSLGFENASGKATVGVMEPGEYEFNTGAPERMTLISGRWALKLPGSEQFIDYPAGQSVVIPGNSKFQLKIAETSAYHCAFL